MNFIDIYIVAALLTFYFVTSFIVSVDSISDNLLLTSPSEWCDEVTLVDRGFTTYQCRGDIFGRNVLCH
jgi:hypothetical protein